MTAAKHRIYFLLQRAAHAVAKQSDRLLLEEAGITTAQAAVLATIGERGGISQRAIAEALGLNESALTPMIARLREAGWIRRTRDAGDARSWCIHASADGRRVLTRLGRAFSAINAGIDASVGRENTPAFADQLAALVATFALDDWRDR